MKSPEIPADFGQTAPRQPPPTSAMRFEWQKRERNEREREREKEERGKPKKENYWELESNLNRPIKIGQMKTHTVS